MHSTDHTAEQAAPIQLTAKLSPRCPTARPNLCAELCGHPRGDRQRMRGRVADTRVFPSLFLFIGQVPPKWINSWSLLRDQNRRISHNYLIQMLHLIIRSTKSFMEGQIFIPTAKHVSSGEWPQWLTLPLREHDGGDEGKRTLFARVTTFTANGLCDAVGVSLCYTQFIASES